MEITGDSYRIDYEPSTTTITCQGTLRLYGAAGYVSIEEFSKYKMAPEQTDADGYTSIMALFNKVLESNPEKLTFNIQDVKHLNSSGINAFSKFVIKLREIRTISLTIQGAQKSTWQKKVIQNLQRLMPGVVVEWKD